MTSQTKPNPHYDYIKQGSKIYDKSFAIIRNEANLEKLPQELETIAVRMIHSCGMTDIPDHLDFSPHVVSIARTALQNGAPILCDANMIASGITQSRLPNNNPIVCTLRDLETPRLAEQLGTTRSAAALELWHDQLENAIVAIGNAPTALFHLLEGLAQGWPKPAAIIGMPVGFVGAIESKQALASNSLNVPYITLHGRRGGSAMTVAAINAIAQKKE